MLGRPNTALSQIHMQIMWSRLIAVVEEQAQTLVRTAFSTPVREAGDLSAGIFDLHGRMLAQAVTGTPGHVNSMMESTTCLDTTNTPGSTTRQTWRSLPQSREIRSGSLRRTPCKFHFPGSNRGR